MTEPAKNRRRFPRHAVAMWVSLKERGGATRFETLDISRHGAFLLSDDPKPLRQLLQLEFQPPEASPIQVMAKVVRVVEPGNEYQFVSGMGVDFFALSNEAKKRWDDFVFGLAANTDSVLEMARNFSEKKVPMVSLAGVPETQPTGTGDKVFCSLASAGGASTEDDHQTNFLLRLKNKRELRDFYDVNMVSGGMFLRTTFAHQPGDTILLTLISSDTEQEFSLAAKVISNQEENEQQRLGYWLALSVLDDGGEARLLEFIETGEELALEFEEEEILEDFEDQAWTAHQSPWALAEQGKQRLFRPPQPDAQGALQLFRDAVTLDPSYLPAHRGECWCLALLERHREAFEKLRAIHELRKKLHRGLDRLPPVG